MSKEHSTPKSFVFAFSGIREALKNEPNLRIHFLVGLLAIVLAFYFSFTSIEWIILLITICFVLMVELINTSLEALVNLVSPELKTEAKLAKDVAAAAVLISAVLSIVVGIFLFLPKFF